MKIGENEIRRKGRTDIGRNGKRAKLKRAKKKWAKREKIWRNGNGRNGIGQTGDKPVITCIYLSTFLELTFTPVPLTILQN